MSSIPLLARMVADASGVGNQPCMGDAERPALGNQSTRLQDGFWSSADG
jgi:hypothetical protein